jgi:hypothetical protein
MRNRRTNRLRHALYYEGVARRAGDFYDKGGENVIAGLALFDHERRQIDAGWGWTMAEAQTQSSDEAIDQLLLDFANATAYVGELRYSVRNERIPQIHASIDAARRLSHRGAEGTALVHVPEKHPSYIWYHATRRSYHPRTEDTRWLDGIRKQ